MEIYYIGGSPCCGKSTVAEMLAARHSLEYIKLDDYLFEWIYALANAGDALAAKTVAMSPQQTWMRDPQLMCSEELALYRSMWPLVKQKITHTQPKAGGFLVEGAGLLPELAATERIAKNRFVCMAPTETFQREKYAERTFVDQVLEGYEDKAAAFDNWMRRDALFARAVLRQAAAFGYAGLVVDGAASIAQNARAVARQFGLE